MKQIINEKSELLFLYETSYSIPNGDPFTNEQRYDEDSKKILISDVRIKRFIREYLQNNGETIYVIDDKTSVESGEKITGAAARMKSLVQKFSGDSQITQSEESTEDGSTKSKSKGKKAKDGIDYLSILKKCIDVRLFGGILTQESNAINLTGPVQFALLNPSINSVNLRMHQNTSVFSSSTEKSRGSIATTTVVPYALNQIHGWINPYSAEYTDLKDEDVSLMIEALWNGINNANTRTKQNQNSLLMLQIIYSEKNFKLYSLDKLIEIKSEKARMEEIRSFSDYKLDFSKLIAKVQSDKVKEVRYFSENDEVLEELANIPKFKRMNEKWIALS